MNNKLVKKTLSGGPSAILRALNNINVAKVCIVKWSQINISIYSNPPSCIASFFLNVLKTEIIENVGYARNGTSSS